MSRNFKKRNFLMGIEVDSFFLTSEFHLDEKIDDFNNNTDVVVQLRSGKKYIASFFSFKNIEYLRVEHQITKRFLSGKYFHVNNMVLIDDCSVGSIREVIDDLIEGGNFESVFKNMTS